MHLVELAVFRIRVVPSGNAFAILGRCVRGARRAGWSEDEICAFTDDACSGDYDSLLTTVMLNFNVT